jgi:hypothetical protein
MRLERMEILLVLVSVKKLRVVEKFLMLAKKPEED